MGNSLHRRRLLPRRPLQGRSGGGQSAFKWLFSAGAAVACVVAAGSSQVVHAQVLDISSEGEISIHSGVGSGGVMEVLKDGGVMVRGESGAVSWKPLGKEVHTLDGVAESRVPAGAIRAAAVPNVPDRYVVHVDRAAAAASISPALLAAVVWQESRWNALAVSPKGAIGLTQLMPGTARELGVNPRDPVANLYGGARYLRAMLDTFGGDVERALAAYNAGASRVRKANGVPPITETRNYVKSIVDRLSAMSVGGSQ